MARHGPTPSSELEALVLELRRRVPMVPTGRRLEIRALSTLGFVAALRDDFDTARRLCMDANSLAMELGTQSFVANEVDVELLAGNWPAAEHAVRAELEALEQIGDMGHYASLVLPLVDALVPQGRAEESRAAVELAARWAIDDDRDAQMGLHCSQAALLVVEGDLVNAEEHARKAVAIAESSDYIIRRIRALSGLADVLAAAGRPDEARDRLERAIALAQEKESLAHERTLRAKLVELAAQPPATA
jgi:Flp pilus assembly protein TadD